MQRLFFVRHGQSVANEQDICAGHMDVSLSEKGKDQAFIAAKNAGTFDLIVTSPLSRAFDTAVIIATEIKYPIDKIHTSNLFIERYRGDLEGKPTGLQSGMTEDEYLEHGAESEKSLIARANEAYEWLIVRPEARILVVSHNNFGKYFIAKATGKNLYSEDRIPNAQISEISSIVENL